MPANPYKRAFIRSRRAYPTPERIIAIDGRFNCLTSALRAAIKQQRIHATDFIYSCIQFEGSSTSKHLYQVGQRLSDQDNPFKHIKAQPL